MPRTIALCSIVTTLLATASAAHANPTPASTNPVVRDCIAHNALTAAYSSRALTRALHGLPIDVAEYSSCPASIKSQLAGLHGPAGKPYAGAVIKDFARHGSLRFSYRAATLRAALRRAQPDANDFTSLTAAIRSQLITAKSPTGAA